MPSSEKIAAATSKPVHRDSRWLATEFVDFCDIRAPEVAINGLTTVEDFKNSESVLLRVRLSTRLTILGVVPMKKKEVKDLREYFDAFRERILPNLEDIIRLIQKKGQPEPR